MSPLSEQTSTLFLLDQPGPSSVRGRASKAGVTALMGAARAGHRSTVESLLKAGADPGGVDDGPRPRRVWRPLDPMVGKGLAMAQVLLDEHATAMIGTW